MNGKVPVFVLIALASMVSDATGLLYSYMTEADCLENLQTYEVAELSEPQKPIGSVKALDATFLVGQWEGVFDTDVLSCGGLVLAGKGPVRLVVRNEKRLYDFRADGSYTYKVVGKEIHGMKIDLRRLPPLYAFKVQGTGTWRFADGILVLVETAEESIEPLSIFKSQGKTKYNGIEKRLRVNVFNKNEVGFQFESSQSLCDFNCSVYRQTGESRGSATIHGGYDRHGFEVVRIFQSFGGADGYMMVELSSPSHYKRVDRGNVVFAETSQAAEMSQSAERQTSNQPEQYYVHVVEDGQTLPFIAKGFETTVPKILAANPGLTSDRLHVGQKLIIPAEGMKLAETKNNISDVDTGDETEKSGRRGQEEKVMRRASPKTEAMRQRVREEPERTVQKVQAEQVEKLPYRIIDLAREKGSDFAYTFTLELSGNASIQTFFGVQSIFANEVRAAYQMEYPNADASALRVVVQPRLSNGKIVGRAEVLTITPEKLSYDPDTRRGKLSVRFNAGQAEEARAWIRRNIETLARDKNIALTTGQLPPAATYYSLGEKVDGNVMEIEFKTE